VLYEIDRLSLANVNVFNDGELKVTAKATAPSSVGFNRPASVARARPGSAGGAGVLAGTGAGLLSRSSEYGGVRSARLAGGVPPRPASAPRGAVAGVSGSSQRVLAALQSLTPAEVERLEAAVRQERAALGAGR
jgi:hypothetical protein